MKHDNLRERTQRFALRIIAFVEALPRGGTSDHIGRQMLRCGTSIGATYRGACRARSRADFVAKMGIVEEEADESAYWLELLVEAGIVEAEEADNLLDEANQLIAITVSSIQTARRNKSK